MELSIYYSCMYCIVYIFALSLQWEIIIAHNEHVSVNISLNLTCYEEMSQAPYQLT